MRTVPFFLLGLLTLNPQLAAAQQKDLARGAAMATIDGADDRYALLIGVDQYDDDQIEDLRYSALDAKRIAEVLISSGAWRSENVIVMTPDQKDARLRPSRANVLEQLSALQRLHGAETVLVYFSGHGSAKGSSASPINYLYPTDTRETVPEDTAIAEARVVEILKDIDADRKVLIMDACRNQLNVGAKGSPSAWNRSDFQLARGTWIVYSTQFGEYSYEDDVAHLGAMTRYLAEGLEGRADGYGDRIPDGVVSFREAIDYTTRMLSSSRANLPAQTPWVAGDGSWQEFPLNSSGLAVEGPPCPWTTAMVQVGATKAIQAWSAGERLAFHAEVNLVEDRLQCVDEPISGETAATLHRMYALRRYSFHDFNGTVDAFAAAARSAPNSQVMEGIPRSDGTLDALAREATQWQDQWQPIELPRGLSARVDGQTNDERPLSSPAVVQIVNCDGSIQWSAWYPGEAALPSINPNSGAECHHPLRTGLTVGTVGLALGAGGLLAGAMLTRNEWADTVHSGGMTEEDWQRAQTLEGRANHLGTAAVGVGGAAALVGLGVAFSFK